MRKEEAGFFSGEAYVKESLGTDVRGLSSSRDGGNLIQNRQSMPTPKTWFVRE